MSDTKLFGVCTGGFLSLLLIALLARAEISGMGTVEEAKKQADVKCVNGCIVLSREDMAGLEVQIKEALKESYTTGLHTCRNSI